MVAAEQAHAADRDDPRSLLWQIAPGSPSSQAVQAMKVGVFLLTTLNYWGHRAAGHRRTSSASGSVALAANAGHPPCHQHDSRGPAESSPTIRAPTSPALRGRAQQVNHGGV